MSIDSIGRIAHAPLPIEAQLEAAQERLARVRTTLAHWERYDAGVFGFTQGGGRDFEASRDMLRSCISSLRAALEGPP